MIGVSTHNGEGPVLARLADRLRCLSARARALTFLAVGFAVAYGLISLLVDFSSLRPPRLYEKDFVQEYLLARAIADRRAPYAPVQDLAARYLPAQPDQSLTPGMGVRLWLPTPHPPPVGLLSLPLALVDYQVAARIWFGLELGLLVISVVLVGRTIGVRLPLLPAAGVALVLVGWTPVRQELNIGQLSMLLLVLVAAAWLSMQSARPINAGVYLGLALAIKPVVWLVLPLLLLRKQWRTVGAALAVLFVAYAVALLAIGPSQLTLYLTQVLPAVNAMYASSDRNLSLAGLIDFHDPTAAGVVLSYAARLLLVGVAWVALRSCWRIETWLGIGICVSLLINPITWDNYLLLTLLPIVQVGANLIRRALSWRERAIAGLAAALTSFPLGLWMDSIPYAWSTVQAGFTMALLLLTWLVVRTDVTPESSYAE